MYIPVPNSTHLKRQVGELAKLLNCTLTGGKRSPLQVENIYIERENFVSSHGFSSCPNVSITVSTSRPPLPLCGAGYRDGKTGHSRSPPQGNPQSHVGHRATTSIHLTRGSCRVLSPPHLLLHLTVKYLVILGQKHTDDTQAFVSYRQNISGNLLFHLTLSQNYHLKEKPSH